MIKKFEQFVSAKYGRHINEGFQSSKLREIIRKHGLPKNDWDKKMLYDLQDDEIVDVVANSDEYYEKYYNERYRRNDGTFKIELKDDACLVIGNLGILNNMFKEHEDLDRLFKQRRSERHKGNLGKHGGDEIHMKHLENVDKIMQKRFAAKLQPMVPEIVEEIKDGFKDEMEELNPCDLSNGESTAEFEITLGNEKYGIAAEYKVDSNGYDRHGVTYYDIYCDLISFEIWNYEDDIYVTNDMLGITSKTHSDLFDTITIDNVEGDVYDYYEYYGVSRSDFI